MEEETLAAIIGRRKLQGDDSIIQEKVCHISRGLLCIQPYLIV